MKQLRQSITAELAIVLAILAIVFFLLFSPVLKVGYTLIDDHELFQWFEQKTAQGTSALHYDFLNMIWQHGVLDQYNRGLWRPVQYVFKLAEAAILGPRASLWRVVAMLIGVLSLTLFYGFLRLLTVPRWIAALAVALLILHRGVTGIWYATGFPETLGNLFIIAAALCAILAARRQKSAVWDGALLLLLILAGETKESYVLTIPAILLMRLTLQCWYRHEDWQQALRTCWLLIGLGLLFFAVSVLFLLFVLPRGYGIDTSGLSVNSFNPLHWLSDFVIVSPVVGSYLPFLLAGIVLFGSAQVSGMDQRLRGYSLWVALIFLMWTIPQFILQTKVFDAHYLYPTLLGIAAPSALCLTLIWRSAERRIKTVCTVGLIVLAIPAVLNFTYLLTDTNYFTARADALNRTVADVVSHSDGYSRTVVVDTAPENFEPAQSMARFLQFYGLHSPLYYYSASSPASEIQNAYNGILSKDDTGQDIGIVVWLNPQGTFTSNPPAWYSATHWQRVNYTNPVFRAGLSFVPRAKVDEIGFTADYRQTSP